MLARSSRCAPKPPRASDEAIGGDASSSAVVIAIGTAEGQSSRTGVNSSELPR